MKYLLLLPTIVLFCLIGFYILPSNESKQPHLKPSYIDTNIIAYDWEHDINITRKMADTMIFSGGHWYGKSNLPKTHYISRRCNEPRWIRPSGSERIYTKSKETERMWRDREKGHQCLTEDDIRQIIEDNYK